MKQPDAHSPIGDLTDGAKAFKRAALGAAASTATYINSWFGRKEEDGGDMDDDLSESPDHDAS